MYKSREYYEKLWKEQYERLLESYSKINKNTKKQNMLSNLKLEVIEKKLAYLKAYLKKEGKYLDRQGMATINKQLNVVKKQLVEAKERKVIGYTENKLAAYTAASVIDNVDVELLYIESLPTGYDISEMDTTKGESIKLQIEGDWSETVTFI
tara:strand:+ start:4919 stop:5374 length:456 start_codon:yes stop_codon:yes gene_type:complete